MDPREFDLLKAEHALCTAQIAYHTAKREAIEAKLEAVPQDQKIKMKAFDPAWKSGIKLSKEGQKAIREAYKQGMSQSQVAQLFRIAESSAAKWQQRTLDNTDGVNLDEE